ncbi:MAG: Flagellar basal-body rod protein FlgF [Micavibrio sp.]|nr:Flagellar basal-body rod protein FlgF [Micavibrio sp.]
MENSIYVGLSRQAALQSEMDTVANNLANVNTPGFRAQFMMYKEYVEKPRGIEHPISMVEDYGQFMSNKPGSFRQTGNSLDVALQGTGFFSVQDASGETLYTRAGNFSTNANGGLVTTSGQPVLDGGGAPITIPPNSKFISIGEDGTLSTDAGVFSRLGITEFENVNKLKPVGDNMYDGKDAGGATAQNTRAMQGAIESSNVNPIMEMTHMIDVSRAYQTTARLLQNEHDRQLTMIQRLSRAS